MSLLNSFVFDQSDSVNLDQEDVETQMKNDYRSIVTLSKILKKFKN